MKRFADWLEPYAKIGTFFGAVFAAAMAIANYFTGTTWFLTCAVVTAVILVAAWAIWWIAVGRKPSALPAPQGDQAQADKRAVRASGRSRVRLTESAILNQPNAIEATDDAMVDVHRSVIR